MTQSEALKKAKSKYYEKLKEDPEYRAMKAAKAREHYANNKERHRENHKKYYENHKEEMMEKHKIRRDAKILNDVISKIESIDVKDLAKILIETKKTKLLQYDINDF